MEADSHFSVLIVDDDISDLNALYNILKSSYTVYFAKSGDSAIKRAVENHPDIILLDVVMPDIDGYEVLSELKRMEATRNIPVIFITGLGEVEDELAGFDLGAVDYITKPFHGAIVNARIKSHLKIARQLSEIDNRSVLLKTRQVTRNIPFRELLYVATEGHWVNFHLTGGEVVKIYSSLKEYADILLAEPRFARCHASFLANMDFVELVEVRNVLMKNGDSLPISKRYSDFKNRYIEWINGYPEVKQ